MNETCPPLHHNAGTGGDGHAGEVLRRPVPGAAAAEDRHHWYLPTGAQKAAEIIFIGFLLLLAAACTTNNPRVELDVEQCRLLQAAWCRRAVSVQDQSQPDGIAAKAGAIHPCGRRRPGR